MRSQAKRRLERRVALLRPESLDRDMLEERARAVLNLARPEDRVILLNRGQ
jgi:cell division protein FtsB